MITELELPERGSGRACPVRTLAARVWSGPVLVPWLVSRLVVSATLMVVGARSVSAIPDYTRLVMWDGNWYRIIATSGYGPAPHAGMWSTWPFFPLLPALVWLLRQLGAPYTVALLVWSNTAAFVAFTGVHRAAGMFTTARAARWAVWLTALFPGAITLVMAYPDSLYLAGTVWAFVYLARHQPARAGLAAAIATAARPNGAVVLVALTVAALDSTATSRGRRIALVIGPSAVLLAGWLAWLRHATGDPFVFLHAKQAWTETSLTTLITSPLHHRWGLLQFLLGALLVLPFLRHRSRYPRSWHILTLVSLAPSFAFGIVGLARYSICCFPLAIAAADHLTSRRRHRPESATFSGPPGWPLAITAMLLIAFGLLITQGSYVP